MLFTYTKRLCPFVLGCVVKFPLLLGEVPGGGPLSPRFLRRKFTTTENFLEAVRVNTFFLRDGAEPMDRRRIVTLAVLGINAFARATLLSRGMFVSTTLAESVIGGAEASSSSESGSGSGTGIREPRGSFGDAACAGGGVCGGAAGT